MNIAKLHLAPCNPFKNLDHDVDGCEAILAWEMEDCVPDYKLKIRKFTSTTWDVVVNPSTSPYLFEGDPGYTYKWRVEALCSPDELSDHTNGSDFLLTTCNKIGLNDGKEPDDLYRIYPNPSSGSFEVALPFLAEQDQTANIEVLNHFGQAMDASSVTVTNGLIRYSLANTALPSGIYVVRVIVNGNAFRMKVALTGF